MTKKLKTPRFASTHSTQVVKARRDGSRTHAASATSVVHAVTPTSERIIKETSVERREAMKVLANRKAALSCHLGRRHLRSWSAGDGRRHKQRDLSSNCGAEDTEQFHGILVS